MEKPLCDWCSEKEYHISVLNEGHEELLCKDCYKEFLKRREEREISVSQQGDELSSGK